MDWKKEYHKWVNFSDLKEEHQNQLKVLSKNKNNHELEDCFYTHLEFGTGGMRGKIGTGPNRMNIYTIRRAAEGLAQYIVSNGDSAKEKGVVIAYDSRHKSYEFAIETAKTLGNHNIQAYVFEDIRSTPELSFAVRYLNTFSGVVITASHNPSIYNGFKVYGSDGAQYANEEADQIVQYVNRIEDELHISVKEETTLKQTGMLKIIGQDVDNAYQAQLQSIILDPDKLQQTAEKLRIVYTPLHGTGNTPVRRALALAGFTNVESVEEQALPDGDFPTVEFPNPEEASAFSLAIEYGKNNNADILMATDPDADRVGIAIRKDDTFQLLTGNQIGAILLDYMMKTKYKNHTLPKNGVILKTIVTSELGKQIAKEYGVETIDVLTGFKYISANIKAFEQNKNHSFLFGYEESHGYLISDFVRDKDAVQTCLLLSEAAAYYQSINKSILDILEEIYEQYGYYQEDLVSLTLEGKQGTEQINQILTGFREKPPQAIATKEVLIIEDYLVGESVHHQTNQTEKIYLPKSNVLKFKLQGGAWICLRPSGTEPKIKIYFGVKEDTFAESRDTLESLKDAIMEKVNNFI